MESLKNPHVGIADVGHVDISSPSLWLDNSFSSGFTPLQLSLSPSLNALPCLTPTSNGMSPSQLLESHMSLNELLYTVPLSFQPLSYPESSSHPLICAAPHAASGTICSQSNKSNDCTSNGDSYPVVINGMIALNHCGLFPPHQAAGDCSGSEYNSSTSAMTTSSTSTSTSTIAPNYTADESRSVPKIPDLVQSANGGTCNRLIKPSFYPPQPTSQTNTNPFQPNHTIDPNHITNGSSSAPTTTTCGNTPNKDHFSIPPHLIRKHNSQQPQVIRPTLLPPSVPSIPPQQLHQPHIVTIPNTIAIPSPNLYPPVPSTNGTTSSINVTNLTSNVTTPPTTIPPAAMHSKLPAMDPNSPPHAILTAVIKDSKAAENLLNSMSKKYNISSLHNPNTPPNGLLHPNNPGQANQASPPTTPRLTPSPPINININSNLNVNSTNSMHNNNNYANVHSNGSTSSTHGTTNMHSNNHTATGTSNGTSNSNSNSSSNVNMSNGIRNKANRNNKYSLLVNSSIIPNIVNNQRKRSISMLDSDSGTNANSKSDRKTRPKVVASKGAIQCVGKNRKLGTRCRNAALMEYIGPAPQYCAEHIELDPSSLYCKCTSTWHKAIGDGKRCKEVVLKEFGMCHKHITDVLSSLDDNKGFNLVEKYLKRSSELLVNLEKEASSAKKTDADLFQRKNKLIPKFQEMRQHIMHKYKEMEAKGFAAGRSTA